MENFNQEHKDEVEFLSKNDPKGNKKGRRTGKFVPINEAPDVVSEEDIIEKIDKGELEEIHTKDFYEKEIEQEEVSEEEDKESEEYVRKMSRKIKTSMKEGVAHIGPDVKVSKQPIVDIAEHGDVEIAGKKIKNRTLSKFGKFLPGFMSKSKRLISILPNDFLSRKKGQRWKYGSINKKEENLKTLNKLKPKENFGGHATISRLARQNREKIRKEMLHNPEVWEEEKKRLNPEDLMSE